MSDVSDKTRIVLCLMEYVCNDYGLIKDTIKSDIVVDEKRTIPQLRKLLESRQGV